MLAITLWKRCLPLVGVGAALIVLSCAGCSSRASPGSLEEAETVAIRGIALPPTLRLDTASEKTQLLTPVLTPATASVKGLTWSSDAPSVATVDATGLVTAVSAGRSVITVTTPDGAMHARCSVYVFALWLHDDFEDGSTDRWDLHPPDGAFTVESDESRVLKYEARMAGGVLATVAPAAWSSVPSGDYYVEARIKPLANSTTGNKQLYLIARYQTDQDWYAAGLNVQSSTSSTQVEIAKMMGGALSRPVQVKAPIELDTWYTVRFQLTGNTLAVYLDGVLIKSVTDAQWSAGPIGLYTANKSFEIDDVKVGDPKDLPVQLAIDAREWSAEAKGAPKTVHVTAKRPSYEDGVYLDDVFTALSSDPAVVAVAIEPAAVTLTPRAAGKAVVAFASGTDSSLKRALSVTVEPEFVQSPATYALGGRTTPAAGETEAYADTRLSITFDSPPMLGTSGSVRIFRASDDMPVDVIRLEHETDAIGYPGEDGKSQLRYVNSDSRIKRVDTQVFIVPHARVLEFGREYYVAISDGLLTGSLNGARFAGIGKAGGWAFTTKAEPDRSKTTLRVDDDGNAADFRTVQGALDFVMKNVPGTTAATIEVKNGTYDELLFLRGHDNVSIVGESRAGVVIQAKNYESLNPGTGASQGLGAGNPAGGRSVFLVENSDLLTLDTLTLRNTMRRSTSESSQAETIYFNADAERLIAKNADFLSEQDTLQLKGYAWFYKTLVAGNVDFIWGANHVALFEESEIRSVGDSAAAGRGYVVQARTVAPADKGFVFLNSDFTHGAGPAGADVATGAEAATYLARSSGNATAWDNVAIVHCALGDHIHPVGWAYDLAGQPKSNPATSTAASGWREYGSRGPGGDMSQRRNGYALTPDEAEQGFATRAQVFAAYGNGAGWNPTP